MSEEFFFRRRSSRFRLFRRSPPPPSPRSPPPIPGPGGVGRSGAGSLWLGPGPGRGPGRVRCGRVVGRVVGPLRSGEGGVRDGACSRMNE